MDSSEEEGANASKRIPLLGDFGLFGGSRIAETRRHRDSPFERILERERVGSTCTRIPSVYWICCVQIFSKAGSEYIAIFMHQAERDENEGCVALGIVLTNVCSGIQHNNIREIAIGVYHTLCSKSTPTAVEVDCRRSFFNCYHAGKSGGSPNKSSAGSSTDLICRILTAEPSLPLLFTLALVGRTGRANPRRNCSHPAIGPLHCWPNPQRDESELMSLYLLLGFLHDEAGRL
jgi:hypothetical protein